MYRSDKERTTGQRKKEIQKDTKTKYKKNEKKYGERDVQTGRKKIYMNERRRCSRSKAA